MTVVGFVVVAVMMVMVVVHVLVAAVLMTVVVLLVVLVVAAMVVLLVVAVVVAAVLGWCATSTSTSTSASGFTGFGVFCGNSLGVSWCIFLVFLVFSISSILSILRGFIICSLFLLSFVTSGIGVTSWAVASGVGVIGGIIGGLLVVSYMSYEVTVISLIVSDG